jgi:hypothetical protein
VLQAAQDGGIGLSVCLEQGPELGIGTNAAADNERARGAIQVGFGTVAANRGEKRELIERPLERVVGVRGLGGN